jgi:hypothetical protein
VTNRITTTLPCPTVIPGVVGSNFDGYNFKFSLVLFCCSCFCGTGIDFQSQSMGEDNL